jgi:hypothetical protein
MPAARPDALAAKTSHGEAERSGRAIDELVGLRQMQISRILRQAISKLRAYVVAENARGAAA